MSRPSELLNGTRFDMEVSVAPRSFTNIRKINFNKTTRIVTRIVVARFKVAARGKNPEAMTFVPLFVSSDSTILDPANCDVVGDLDLDGCINLNPSFVAKHENGKERVRCMSVRFECDESTDDFVFGDLDIPSQFDEHLPPCARKVAAKKFPVLSIKGQRPSSPTPSRQEEEEEEEEAEDTEESDFESQESPAKKIRKEEEN